MTAGRTWRSYQEDVDLARNSAGLLTNVPLSQDQRTVPLSSFSGHFAPGFVNAFNGSNQYNYAAKHNPMVFFTDTNGGDDTSTTNPLACMYAPLQQLFTDLADDSVADYNWITPNQYNDMHSALTGGFTYNGKTFTGDQASIAQGDNFLSQIIPKIEATSAFQNGTGMIEIWDDESEGGDTSAFAIPEIIISKDAVGNAFDVTELVTHSGSLLTDQEIFQTGSCLLASCGATDLSAAFLPGAIPTGVPEPASIAVLGVGLLGLLQLRRKT
jgi:hypothetical protein